MPSRNLATIQASISRSAVSTFCSGIGRSITALIDDQRPDPLGHLGVGNSRAVDRLKDSWSEDHIDLVGTEAIDDDLVLLHVHWRTRGKESGIDVDFEAWIVARFREGKIYKVEFYLDREQAMRACGRTT